MFNEDEVTRQAVSMFTYLIEKKQFSPMEVDAVITMMSKLSTHNVVMESVSQKINEVLASMQAAQISKDIIDKSGR